MTSNILLYFLIWAVSFYYLDIIITGYKIKRFKDLYKMSVYECNIYLKRDTVRHVCNSVASFKWSSDHNVVSPSDGIETWVLSIHETILWPSPMEKRCHGHIF